MSKSMFSIRNIALSAVLVAFALILGLVEQWIPVWIAVPGIRLGLANIATVFALYSMGVLPALIVLLLRCILGALFAGTFTSFAFSICGGLLAFLVMWGLSKSKHVSPLGVCVGGSAFHNIGQIAAAMLLLTSKAPLACLPVLLLISVITGVITGVVSSLVMGAVNGVTYVADAVITSRKDTGEIPVISEEDIQLPENEPEQEKEPDVDDLLDDSLLRFINKPVEMAVEPQPEESAEAEPESETYDQIMQRLKIEKEEEK